MTHLAATLPEFLDLFPEGAPLTRLAEGFTWAEGPVYHLGADAVIFSDVRQNRTWRWSRSEGLQEEMHPSHHQNGHTVDAGGRLVACSHGQRALVRQEENGAWTILAETFEGRRLSSPNDVTLHPDGSLWFTDPTYGIDQPEEGYGGEREQPGNHVYRLAPDGTLTAPIRDRRARTSTRLIATTRRHAPETAAPSLRNSISRPLAFAAATVTRGSCRCSFSYTWRLLS